MTVENVELPAVPELDVPLVDLTVQNPYHIALLVDNVVYQVMNVNGEFAAQLLANPEFIQIFSNDARIGWVYNRETGKFSQPS